MVLFSSLANDAKFKTFHQTWSDFIHAKKINFSRIGSKSYREEEFSLLEEFTYHQSIRYRPYLDSMDRWEDCRPYSDNRITLLDGTEMSASFVSSFVGYHHFIATQAPFASNRHLFWQMILENKIDQIVMVTELMEERGAIRELASSYWPEKIGGKLTLENGLEITLIEETHLLAELQEFIEIRRFKVHAPGIERILTHYWYRNWMDRTAPLDEKTILALIYQVECDKSLSGSNSPILVHCSAGVGRTGVFVTLYHVMQRKKCEDQKIDLFHWIAYLRWQRPYAVCFLPQYEFCYRVSQDF